MGNVILTPVGGIISNITGVATNPILNVPFAGGKWLGGLVPMIPCGFKDCRVTPQRWCYWLPVFGTQAGAKASYQNDWNTFPVAYTGSGTPKFTLQRATSSFMDGKDEIDWIWSDVADIDNTGKYGILQNLGTVPGHPTYMIFQVNWGSVYAHNKNGFYRILFQDCQTNYANVIQPRLNGIESPATVWSGPPLSATVDISITCGKKTYTLPTFTVKGNEQADCNAIAAAINAATGPSFPFTASVAFSSGHWLYSIIGTMGASQNGCRPNIVYKIAGGDNIINDATLTGGAGNGTQVCNCGLQSPVFQLFKWDCMRAHGTVKFEVWNQGTIGDVNNPGTLFDYCGLSMYDSIRVKGFFGYGKYSYDELLLEFGIDSSAMFGQIERNRDKFIPSYKFNSQPLPDWVHKQLASFMMMADTVLASDYNVNNSNYYIQRKNVVKKGGYEPKFNEKGKRFDLSMKEYERRDSVSIEFLEGIQSGIKSTCCITL